VVDKVSATSRKVVKAGLSWQTASVAIQALMQMVVLSALARLVEPAAFGLVAMANVAIAFGQLLSEAGAGSAVVQRQKPVDHAFISAAFMLSVGIGVVLFAAQAVLSPWLEAFFGMPGLQPVLITLGLVFVIMGAGRVCEALLQREMRFAVLMKINFTAQVLGYAVPAVVLALLGFGVWALVGATLLQTLLRTALYMVFTRHGFGVRTSWTDVREVAAFGIGATQTKFWVYIMGQGDHFIVGRRFDADALGQYQVMTQLAFMPGMHVGSILDAVFFPVASRLKGNPEKLRSVYLTLMSYSFVFMAGLGFYLAANAPLLVNLLLGERWLDAVPVFQVLCLGAGFRITIRVGDAVNRALGQVYAAARRKMFLAILFLLVVWFSVPYGLVVVSLAVVCFQALNALLASHLAWQEIGVAWATSRTALGRTLLGLMLLVALNSGFLLLAIWTSYSAWLIAVLSALAHVGIGLMFFLPLIRMWRGGGLTG
jgi:PST family polysaccharide transporter